MPHFYVRWKFACPASSADQHENWCIVFLLPRTLVRMSHFKHSFACPCWQGNIYIDMWYRRKFLCVQQTLLKSSWCPPPPPTTTTKKKLKITGVTADAGVNMCLYHTRNRIAVQNILRPNINYFIYFETSKLILSTFPDITPQASCNKCLFNQNW